MKEQKAYGNESISSLKGADRVRLRPAVIFGSDGLEGCEHAVFEILSNAIDEAREGYGRQILVTRYEDHSIEVEDFGRGCPVDWNEKEGKYNWELVFCELYAGGKYQNNAGGDYEFSLGLNGLGSCATQYSSEYFDAIIRRDGFKYTLHFEKGELVGKMKKEPADRKATGSVFRWKPDLAVFTDINIPKEYFEDTLKRQAVVNAGVTFTFRDQEGGKFVKTDYCYPNGILDYVNEIAGEQTLTMPQFWEAERKGRDREDKPEYKVRISAALCFSNRVNRLEYYHNSSWLEHGGAPEKAVKNAFVYAIDAYCKQTNKYTKSESKITFQDVADCLVLVTNCFSTQTSYENQTKKAITNKFVQDAMAEFFRDRLHVYFIENKQEADRIADQVLVNKRSRESAEKARLNIKKKLTGNLDIANRVQKFVDCRTKDVSKREIYIVEGDSALGSVKLSRDAEFQGIMPVRGKILNCLKADYDRIFKSDIIADTHARYYANGNLENGTPVSVVYTELGDSVSNKYLCFIGGDTPICIVESDVPGPTCVVLKESYGNAFVPFLTSHYGRIIVIDPREFNRDGKPSLNLAEFAADQGVDDLIVINYPYMINSKAFIRYLNALAGIQ